MNALPAQGISRLTLLVLSTTILISVMNSSMSSIVLPEMGREFHVGPDALSWMVTAYLIPFATGTVLFGRLADMVGSRRLYLLGLALFAMASLAVAMATTFPLIIALRVVQGFGGAAIPSLAMAAITRGTSREQRGPAMGCTIVAVGLGFGLGPIVGGALTEWTGWQGPFLFTGIVMLLLLPLAATRVPGFRGTSGQHFDFFGAALLGLAVTAGILALNRLPRDNGDVAGTTALLVSIPLWLTLALWTRRAKTPFLPPRIVGNGRFMRMSLVGFTAQGSHFAVIVLIPLLFTQYHDLNTIDIGLRLLPGAAALGVFGMIGGLLVHRLGERVLLIFGTWVLFAGILTLHVAGVEWSTWRISLLYVAIASGYGMIQAGVMKAATDQLPEDQAGIGTGVFNLSFFLGGAVTVAIAGALLRSRESATAAWNPLFHGTALSYSDALIPVVVFALFGFILAIVQQPPRVVAEPQPEAVPRLHPVGPSSWPVQPRAKPNSQLPRR